MTIPYAFGILIYCVVCLTTGPQSLAKRVLHRMRPSAASLNFQYPLSLFLRSPSSCWPLLPRLPVTPSFPLFFLQWHVSEDHSWVSHNSATRQQVIGSSHRNVHMTGRQRLNFKSNSYFKGYTGCAREFLAATASMNLYTGQGRYFMVMRGSATATFAIKLQITDQEMTAYLMSRLQLPCNYRMPKWHGKIRTFPWGLHAVTPK